MTTLQQQAEKEMKEAYNKHFPEANADDLSFRNFTREQMIDRYRKAHEFWDTQANEIT